MSPLRGWGLAVASLLVGTMVVLTGAWPGAGGSAHAHTGLVESVPREGELLPTTPGRLVLTFAEPVTPAPGAILFGPSGAGTPIETSGGAGRDRQISYVLEGQEQGSHALAWRVLSVDGHLVSGTLRFAVGHETALEPPVEESAGRSTSILLAQTVLQASVLLAIGLAWAWRRQTLRPRLRWIQLAALLGVLGSAAGWALATRAWTGLWGPDAAVVVLAAMAGTLLLGVLLVPLGGRAVSGRAAVPVALLGTLALAVALAATGHPRSAPQVQVALVADALHVVAAGLWFGGLAALLLGLRAASPAGRQEVVMQFSRRATVALVLVGCSGLLLAWQVLGSWARLGGTEHGRWLLAKLAVVAGAVVLGTVHRRVLTAAGEAGADGTRVWRWRRSLALEFVLLLVVVVLTGFLTQASPREPRPERVAAVVEVGADDVEVALVPGVVGVNRVEVRVRDQNGLWIPLVEAPEVALRPAGTPGVAPVGGRMQDLGDVHRLTVALTEPGEWDVVVPLRFSRDAAPVVGVTLEVLGEKGQG